MEYYFRTEDSVKLRLTNNQPYSGLFSVDLPVFQGDTVDKMTTRLARTERAVKGQNLFYLLFILIVNRLVFCIVRFNSGNISDTKGHGKTAT